MAQAAGYATYSYRVRAAASPVSGDRSSGMKGRVPARLRTAVRYTLPVSVCATPPEGDGRIVFREPLRNSCPVACG